MQQWFICALDRQRTWLLCVAVALGARIHIGIDWQPAVLGGGGGGLAGVYLQQQQVLCAACQVTAVK